MIPVVCAKKPANFDENVKKPGLRAIAEMVGQVPNPPRTGGRPFKKIAKTKSKIPSTAFPTYWTRALNDLMNSYNQICAYSSFRIHPVTGARSADHMVPKSVQWREVYEWRNYRLACSRLNSRKREFQDVLDPFKIKSDWFVLNLLTFEVEANKGLDPATTKLIEDTINRLGLNDFKSEREEYASDYWTGHVSLTVLKREAPFIAYELSRQNRL